MRNISSKIEREVWEEVRNTEFDENLIKYLRLNKKCERMSKRVLIKEKAQTLDWYSEM